MSALSKKELEILLEQCRGFEKPKAKLEQYVTPATIASDILNFAYLRGDLEGKIIFDIGCGAGRLAIGASLMGAKDVTGFDVDCETLVLAGENAKKLNAGVNWVCMDVSKITGECDTVIQNPPFGAKKKGADRPFLDAAIRVGKVIYSMHKSSTRDFIKDYIEQKGGKITDISQVQFEIPHSYSFHKKRIKRIEVDIYRIERRDEF